MGRSRFVKPEPTKLYLADHYRRAHAELIARKGKDAATAEQLANSAALVAEAEKDNHFIIVKRRLNTGEQQALFAQMMPVIRPGQPTELQSKLVMSAKVAAYMLDWSLTDDDDRPVPYSEDALANLDPITFKEIDSVIDAHTAAVEAEIENLRKNPTGATELKPSFSSVAP